MLLLMAAVVCEWGILRGCRYHRRDEREGGAQAGASLTLVHRTDLEIVHLLLPSDSWGHQLDQPKAVDAVSQSIFSGIVQCRTIHYIARICMIRLVTCLPVADI